MMGYDRFSVLEDNALNSLARLVSSDTYSDTICFIMSRDVFEFAQYVQHIYYHIESGCYKYRGYDVLILDDASLIGWFSPALLYNGQRRCVALIDMNGEFRSTYDIIADIADIWDDLDDLYSTDYHIEHRGGDYAVCGGGFSYVNTTAFFAKVEYLIKNNIGRDNRYLSDEMYAPGRIAAEERGEALRQANDRLIADPEYAEERDDPMELTIKSAAICPDNIAVQAYCDVYYGSDPQQKADKVAIAEPTKPLEQLTPEDTKELDEFLSGLVRSSGT